jgi:hypothetical protein
MWLGTPYYINVPVNIITNEGCQKKKVTCPPFAMAWHYGKKKHAFLQTLEHNFHAKFSTLIMSERGRE